jgi:phytol kinase
VIPTPWLATGLLAAAFLAVIAVGEALARRRGVAPELTRKLDHAAAGPVALVLPFVLDSPGPVLALAGAFLGFLLVTSLVGGLRSVHGIARPSAGAYLYPVAIAATWFATQGHPERYAVAIVALSFADAAGGFVGARWGRRTYAAWGQAKTWEGSLAMLAVTAGLSVPVLLVAGVPLLAACGSGAFVAVIVTLVEGALPFGLDNLGVPLAAVAALAALASVGWPVAAGLLLLGAAALLGAALATRPAGLRARRRPAPTGVAPGPGWR